MDSLASNIDQSERRNKISCCYSIIRYGRRGTKFKIKFINKNYKCKNIIKQKKKQFRGKKKLKINQQTFFFSNNAYEYLIKKNYH